MSRRGVVLSLPFLAAIAILSVCGWISTPPDAQIPVHWGLDGEPDRLSSKLEAFLLLPALALGLTALFAILPAIDPRRRNLAQSRAPFLVGRIGVLAVLALVQGLLTLVAIGAIPADFDVAGGAAALLAPWQVGAIVIGVGVIVAAIASVVMSYVWWRQDPARNES